MASSAVWVFFRPAAPPGAGLGKRKGLMFTLGTVFRLAPGDTVYAASFLAISARCRTWKRTPSRSRTEGWREPSPPAMVLAP